MGEISELQSFIWTSKKRGFFVSQNFNETFVGGLLATASHYLFITSHMHFIMHLIKHFL